MPQDDGALVKPSYIRRWKFRYNIHNTIFHGNIEIVKIYNMKITLILFILSGVFATPVSHHSNTINIRCPEMTTASVRTYFRQQKLRVAAKQRSRINRILSAYLQSVY